MNKALLALLAFVTIAFAAIHPVIGMESASPSFNSEKQGDLTVSVAPKLSIDLTPVTGIAWSPDSKILAVSNISGINQKLNTFNTSGKLLKTFDSETKLLTAWGSLDFLQGSSQILYPEVDMQNGSELGIADAKTGQTLETITPTESFNPGRTIFFAVSPNKKRIAFSPGDATKIAIYRTTNNKHWKQLSTFTNTTLLRSPQLDFFPDNKRLAMTTNDGHFNIIDSTSGKLLKTFTLYSTPRNMLFDGDSIAVSPDGKFIATALGQPAKSELPSLEKTEWESNDHAEITIWRVSDGKRIDSFPDEGRYIILSASVIWDIKNRFIAFTDNTGITIWQRGAIKNYIHLKLCKDSCFFHGIAESPNGKFLAIFGDSGITVLEIAKIPKKH